MKPHSSRVRFAVSHALDLWGFIGLDTSEKSEAHKRVSMKGSVRFKVVFFATGGILPVRHYFSFSDKEENNYENDNSSRNLN